MSHNALQSDNDMCHITGSYIESNAVFFFSNRKWNWNIIFQDCRLQEISSWSSDEVVLVSPGEKSESILEISFNYSQAQQIKNKIAVFAWNYNENAAFLLGCQTGLS